MTNIMKQLTGSVLVLALVLVGVVALTGDVAFAATPANTNEVQDGVNAIGGNEPGNGAAAFTNTIEDVINILLFIIGAAAVIMIIIGGIRYVTSGGDQSAVTGAKNTILYSIVGLVIAIMAYAIVNFVVSKL